MHYVKGLQKWIYFLFIYEQGKQWLDTDIQMCDDQLGNECSDLSKLQINNFLFR